MSYPLSRQRAERRKIHARSIPHLGEGRGIRWYSSPRKGGFAQLIVSIAAANFTNRFNEALGAALET